MKNNSKKFISMVIVSASIFTLSACNNKDDTENSHETTTNSSAQTSSPENTSSPTTNSEKEKDDDLPKEPVNVEEIFSNSLNKQYSPWPDEEAQKLTSAKGVGSEKDKQEISEITLSFFDIVYNYLALRDNSNDNSAGIENEPILNDATKVVEELEESGFFELFVPNSLNQSDKEKIAAFMNVVHLANEGAVGLDTENTIVLEDYIYISKDGKYANVPEYAVWVKGVEQPDEVPNERLLIFEKINGNWYITPDFIRELQLSS